MKVPLAFLLLSVAFSLHAAAPFTRPALGGADEGDLLLATLNCSSCHSAAGLPSDRFPSEKAPVLGPEGLRLTPQFLRAYLTAPQTEKPGTTMPDVLHTLPGAEKSAAVEALTHFLISVAPPEDGAVSPSENLMARGKALYHEVGCVACHAPQDGRAPELAADSVPHGDLAKKYTVPQLVALLQQPAKYRPQRRMPSLNLQKDEATAIAMYLLRSQAAGDPKAGTKMAKGVRFEFFKGEYTNCGRTLENAKPTFTGSLDEIDISRWAREDQSFAVRFSGQFEAPVEGEYTFTIESDDGSRLWIDGRELIDNDGAHPRTARSANITLAAGSHALVLTYFQRAKTGWYLGLNYSYPGNKPKPMRGNLFTHVAGVMQPTGAIDFQVDSAKAEQGRQLYGELGCASCHHTPGVKDLPASKVAGRKLLELAPRSAAGCLADQPNGKAPDFHLSSSQLVALRKTIASAANLQAALTPAAEITRSFNFLNCYACHARDGIGGPHSPRAEFFKSAGEVDLGDEGRIPPHLTKVGAKLKPDWTAEVLLRKGAVRPYLLTRMPQFSAPVVEKLPDLFAQADGGGPIPAEPPYQHETAKLGRSLLGNTGYTCIVCHGYGKHPSLGVPAIDLATAVQRLRPEWFAHYLVDPQSLRPGTRMPSFWPGGKAANPTILGGDTEKQIAAIWMYLTKGPDGDPPPGIVKAKMELVADSTAIMYRNFIKGAGSRAIGVGYPEKANLAFDANELRLALVWQGGFIDASRHRTGRGSGFEPPLGNNVVPFPEGPAFALLPSQADTWPAAANDQHFHGYSLDSLQRPTFRYTVGGVQVEDFPEAVPGQPDPGFKRTLILRATTSPQNLYFRAAAGKKIEDQGNGTFLIDSKVRVKLTGANAFVRRSGDSSELLVPISLTSGELKLTEELSW